MLLRLIFPALVTGEVFLFVEEGVEGVAASDKLKSETKISGVASRNMSPVGSKGTTQGRNRSLLVVQNPPPGFSFNLKNAPRIS